MDNREILNELFKFRSKMDINQFNDLIDDYTRIVRYCRRKKVVCKIAVRDDFGIAVTIKNKSPNYGHLLHDMIWKCTMLNRDISVSIVYTEDYKKKVNWIMQRFFPDVKLTFNDIKQR